MSMPKDLHDAADFICFDRFDALQKRETGWFCENGAKFTVTPWGDGVFRIRISAKSAPDYGILLKDEPDIAGVAEDIGEDGALIYSAGAARLKISQNPLRLTLFNGGDQVVSSITDAHFRGWSRLPALASDGKRYMVSFALTSAERIYGLGEKFGRLNKRGSLIHSYVEDALGVNTDLSYKNAPFAWSSEGWGVFFHSPATVSHGVGYPQWSHRSYTVVIDEPRLDLFLFAGAGPAEMIKTYTNLTGKSADVPLWSYGVWVSRAYYRTPEEIIDAAKTLREKDFPCDVITFDGRAWQDTPTRFEFKFDPARYSDPAGVIKTLREDYGFKICAWEYPLVSVDNVHFDELAQKGYFLKTEQGDVYRYDWDREEKTSPFGKVLTPLPVSGILDFTNPGAYGWWRDQHKRVFDIGVDVMKVDFGEQVPADAVAFNGDKGDRLHSVYPLLYNRCVHEATEAFFGPENTCLWSRAAWAGSQRYPLQWGGDPQSDWEGMAASLRGGLSWGLTGAPFHATDVGGFYGKEQPSAALYLRWVQWSVFSSHFRIHGVGLREPWCFGAQAEEIARKWFKLRYRLIPYLAGLGAVAHETSLPVMRAMVLAFPNDPVAARFEEQFMCGAALLVVPVLKPDHDVQFWLPEAEWLDVWSGEIIQGGRVIRRTDVPLDRIPLFLRAGHALPLGRAVSRTAEIDLNRPAERVLAAGPVTEVPVSTGQTLRLKDGVVKTTTGEALPVVDRLVL